MSRPRLRAVAKAPAVDPSPYAEPVAPEIKFAALALAKRATVIRDSLCGSFATRVGLERAHAALREIGRDLEGLADAVERSL